MRTFKNTVMVLAGVALCCSQAIARTTPKITISCTTYNFDTNLPQTAFHPGDKVLVVVTCSFPNGTITSSTNIALSGNATAAFPGFTFPFTLNPVIGKFQNKNPKTGTQLFLTGDQRTTVFKISSHIPIGTTLSIFLTASAPGLLSGTTGVQIRVIGS